MIQKTIKIEVNGGGASLDTYFLERVSGTAARRRPVVIVCPGGGYNHVSSREGGPVALQFAARGFHSCVLKYSVAPAVFPQALLELAKAVTWVRGHADEYLIDTNKVIICGFSAAGHLAGCLGAFWQKLPGDAPDCDASLRRPNGLILCYPVITSGPFAHKGSFECLTGGDEALASRLSLENRVTDDMPPVFMWHTCGDMAVPAENSLLFAAALRKHHIPLELHIFPKGPHGLALANEDTASEGKAEGIQPRVQIWIDLAAGWLRSL